MKENALDGLLSFPLSRGISIRDARASPRPSAFLHFPPSSPSPPRVSVLLLFPHPPFLSASTEPAAPLFTPTSGGSFCFTFILISDDLREITELCDAIFRFEISNFCYRYVFRMARKIINNSIFTLVESYGKIRLIKKQSNLISFFFLTARYLLSAITKWCFRCRFSRA